MFSAAMFDFFDAMKKEGHQDRHAVAVPRGHHLRHRFRQRQLKIAGERGYKVLADIKYRANSPSLSAEVQQLRRRTRRADAVELHHRRHPAGETMAELGYKPPAIVAQDAGFSEKALYDAVATSWKA